jgi:hypothetical protein
MRKPNSKKTDHRLVYKIEVYYGQSNAKLTLKVTRGGEVVGRDYD